jgi:DNA-binding transcriptional regulator GbsR (MarR family)
MKNTAELTELEDIVVQAAGEMAESLNINRLIGQVFALLYIRPDPVTLDEMVEKLRISKGSASTTIRTLEDWNAVKKIWVPASRKDYYTAEQDFLKVISDRLQHGFAIRLGYANEKMERMEKALAVSGNHKLKKFYQDRLRQFHEIKDLLQTMLKLLPQIRTLNKLKMLKNFL